MLCLGISFLQQRQFLHFVDNNSDHDSDDKFFKIKSIMAAVRNDCIKIVDEQIIPSKTKFTKIRQYNPKKPRKWGFKYLVRVGLSGFIYDFYLYSGRDEVNKDSSYSHLQKSVQIVAKLCEAVPRHQGYMCYFDNWFSTSELFIYFGQIGITAAGTVRANRLQGCPLLSNKDLSKQEWGNYNYGIDLNSGVTIVKWMDDSILQIASDYVDVEPVGTIEHWDQSKQSKIKITCPCMI